MLQLFGQWFVGDGEAWGIFLRLIVCIVFLSIFIGGLINLVKGLKHYEAKYRMIVIASVLWIPAMFSTCASINYAGPDENHDVFRFERPSIEKKSGPETRGMRRERAAGNVFTYLFSAHGILSILASIFVGIPFALCARKALDEINQERVQSGSLMVAFCLAVFFLVVWNAS